MTASVIMRAVNYACEDRHDGAGFTLLIRTVDGRETEVSVNSDGILTQRDRETGEAGNEIFFQPANVASVEILW